MDEVLDKIKNAREGKGLSQTEVATELGIGLRQYQNIESGMFPKYKRQQIQDLERILNISVYESIYAEKVPRGASVESNENEPYINKRRNHKNNHEKKGVHVRGGFTNLSNIEVYREDPEQYEIIGTLPQNLFPGCDYAEKAKGDSMYPIIMNQALLVGKRCSVKGITFGEKYIIKTKDGLDTTKYIHPGTVTDRIKLKAHNKSIPDQEIDLAEIIFVCRVTWIINPT